MRKNQSTKIIPAYKITTQHFTAFLYTHEPVWPLWATIWLLQCTSLDLQALPVHTRGCQAGVPKTDYPYTVTRLIFILCNVYKLAKIQLSTYHTWFCSTQSHETLFCPLHRTNCSAQLRRSPIIVEGFCWCSLWYCPHQGVSSAFSVGPSNVE